MFRWLRRHPRTVDVLLLTVGFVVGMNFLAYIKFAGVDGAYFYQLNPSFHPLIPTIEGIVIGLALAVAEHLICKRLYARYRYSVAVLAHLLITVGVIAVVMLSVDISFRVFRTGNTFPVAVQSAWQFLQSPLMISLFTYALILATLLNFFRQISHRFGPSSIIDLITGRYARRLEEHRAFMFLDLNQSTTIAEQLGHVKYSNLLNQCFSDLSDFLLAYDAEVYQYVGDEVVLTWPTKNVKQGIDVVGLYFAFKQRIDQRAFSYRTQFGLLPGFKASVHCGPVSITQVGHHRKELAYHGDVLNTASRLLSLGSKMQKELLITASFAEHINYDDSYTVHPVDTLLLRGKQQVTEVFEVQLEDNIRKLIPTPQFNKYTDDQSA
ncbi:MAG: adenylate/guanylate cyclase domain-containing protein [Bacteroidota bacterium]